MTFEKATHEEMKGKMNFIELLAENMDIPVVKVYQWYAGVKKVTDQEAKIIHNFVKSYSLDGMKTPCCFTKEQQNKYGI